MRNLLGYALRSSNLLGVVLLKCSSGCQLSLVAEHLLRKQEVGSSILPVGLFCRTFYIDAFDAFDI